MNVEARAPGSAGFSLIEMMAALLIAGLLFFVALPGWQHTLVKSYRAAGRGVLLDVLSRQEQYFINNKRHAVSLAPLGLPATYYIGPQAQQVPAARSVYRIELQLEGEPGSASFRGVRAIPQNRQRNDHHCMILAISRTGVRTASGSLSHAPQECW